MRPDEEMKFAPTELEFLAEDEYVEIVPRFTFQEIELLSGTIGPFKPRTTVKVPLWFALQLRERQMCIIQLPEWLTRDQLSALKQEEEREKDSNLLATIPFHYQEIATLLLRYSPDSFSGVDGEARIQVKDVEEVRESKLHTSLRDVQEYSSVAKISNVGAMEINRIRPFLLNSMHRFRDLKAAEESFSGGGQSQSLDSQGGL